EARAASGLGLEAMDYLPPRAEEDDGDEDEPEDHSHQVLKRSRPAGKARLDEREEEAADHAGGHQQRERVARERDPIHRRVHRSPRTGEPPRDHRMVLLGRLVEDDHREIEERREDEGEDAALGEVGEGEVQLERGEDPLGEAGAIRLGRGALALGAARLPGLGPLVFRGWRLPGRVGRRGEGGERGTGELGRSGGPARPTAPAWATARAALRGAFRGAGAPTPVSPSSAPGGGGGAQQVSGPVVTDQDATARGREAL